MLDQKHLDDLEHLHQEWRRMIEQHHIPCDETLNTEQTADVSELFQKLTAHYKLFGELCEPPDHEFLSNPSLKEIEFKLGMRMNTLTELIRLHGEISKLAGQFPALRTDLERVHENISVLHRYVDNLQRFYDLYSVQHQLEPTQTALNTLVSLATNLPNGATVDASKYHALENEMQRINNELTEFQHRMSSLETVCNEIKAQLAQRDIVDNLETDDHKCMELFITTFDATKKQLGDAEKRLDDAKESLPHDLPPQRPNSQLHDETNSSDSDTPKFYRRGSKLHRRKRTADNGSVEVSNAAPITTTNGDIPSTSSVLEETSNGGLRTRLASFAQRNPAAKTLLSCFLLIGIGLLLLYMTSDDEIFTRSGHWRFKFGPQLRYINGPPPI